ncbi:hypothetical protein GBAR_LOCUS28644 [Geodia barretti]|uniref:Uncharacterized protein n=1 Tax=Geodia barretti TaxID=519541 RepID=A0AA35TQ34_GEOBA|nr:hypothetical protein GBAR_LOCUS28644 [Geodia barretti]
MTMLRLLVKGAVQGIKAADSCEDARKEHTSPDEATSLAAHSHERRRKEEEGGSHIYKQGSQQSADPLKDTPKLQQLMAFPILDG